MTRMRWTSAGAALLLAGCGGSGSVTAASSPAPSAAPSATVAPKPTPTATGSPLPSADNDAITNLVTEVEVIHDYKAQCKQLFTSAYIREAFGTLTDCQKWGFQTLSDYPTSANVTSILGSGNWATGVVTDHGGIVDGATGPWTFERSAAGQWELADESAAYVRGAYADQLGPGYQAQGAEDPFANATYRACVVSALGAKGDDQFKSMVLGLQTHHSNGFGDAINGCSAQAPGGVSPFRVVFETGMKKQAATDHMPTTLVNCIISGLRTAVSDADLVDAVLDGKGSTRMTNLDAQTTVVARNCATNSSSPAPQLRAPDARLGIGRGSGPVESATPTPS